MDTTSTSSKQEGTTEPRGQAAATNASSPAGNAERLSTPATTAPSPVGNIVLDASLSAAIGSSSTGKEGASSAAAGSTTADAAVTAAEAATAATAGTARCSSSSSREKERNSDPQRRNKISSAASRENYEKVAPQGKNKESSASPSGNDEEGALQRMNKICPLAVSGGKNEDKVAPEAGEESVAGVTEALQQLGQGKQGGERTGCDSMEVEDEGEGEVAVVGEGQGAVKKCEGVVVDRVSKERDSEDEEVVLGERPDALEEGGTAGEEQEGVVEVAQEKDGGAESGIGPSTAVEVVADGATAVEGGGGGGGDGKRGSGGDAASKNSEKKDEGKNPEKKKGAARVVQVSEGERAVRCDGCFFPPGLWGKRGLSSTDILQVGRPLPLERFKKLRRTEICFYLGLDECGETQGV